MEYQQKNAYLQNDHDDHECQSAEQSFQYFHQCKSSGLLPLLIACSAARFIRGCFMPQTIIF